MILVKLVTLFNLAIVMNMVIMMIMKDDYADEVRKQMYLFLSLHWSGLHESLQPCSRAARKWRENEEMRRKWRENEEMERD